jgi:hypothetical protein
MLVIGAIVVAGLFVLMIAFTAPAVVESAGASAERISDKAFEAARQEARTQTLAQEGWGYSDANTAAADSAASDYGDDSAQYGDDWGAPAE